MDTSVKLEWWGEVVPYRTEKPYEQFLIKYKYATRSKQRNRRRKRC